MKWDMVGTFDVILTPLFLGSNIQEKCSPVCPHFLFDLSRTILGDGSDSEKTSYGEENQNGDDNVNKNLSAHCLFSECKG